MSTGSLASFELTGSLFAGYMRDREAPFTVQIRRNLTENAWQNAFCFRSTHVPVPVPGLYLFRVHSISILYLFSNRSVLFCSLSVSVPSVNVLGTCSEEQGFWELIYKINDTHLHFMKWVKTVALCKNTNSKLKFSWWKYESSYSKKYTGRWYCNFKAS